MVINITGDVQIVAIGTKFVVDNILCLLSSVTFVFSSRISFNKQLDHQTGIMYAHSHRLIHTHSIFYQWHEHDGCRLSVGLRFQARLRDKKQNTLQGIARVRWMVSPFWATESKGKQDEYFKWKKIWFCALKKFEFAETKGNSVNNCDSLKFIISLRVAFVSSYHRYQKPSYSTVCVCMYVYGTDLTLLCSG